MSKKKEEKPPDDATIAKTLDSLSGKAESILKDAKKLGSLVNDAIDKTKELEAEGTGPLATVWNDLLAIVRMLQAYAEGKYTKIPWGSLVTATAAVLYLISPVDIVPDVVPVVGYGDDAALVAFVLRQVMKDIEAFRAWEAEQPTAAAQAAG